MGKERTFYKLNIFVCFLSDNALLFDVCFASVKGNGPFSFPMLTLKNS